MCVFVPTLEAVPDNNLIHCIYSKGFEGTVSDVSLKRFVRWRAKELWLSILPNRELWSYGEFPNHMIVCAIQCWKCWSSII